MTSSHWLSRIIRASSLKRGKKYGRHVMIEVWLVLPAPCIAVRVHNLKIRTERNQGNQRTDKQFKLRLSALWSWGVWGWKERRKKEIINNSVLSPRSALLSGDSFCQSCCLMPSNHTVVFCNFNLPVNHLIMNCIARFDALNRKNNSISICCAFFTKKWSQDDFETSIFSANFDCKLFF